MHTHIHTHTNTHENIKIDKQCAESHYLNHCLKSNKVKIIIIIKYQLVL